MAELGIAGISVNAIAKRMGVTGPALYRYFAGRDDLLNDLIRDAWHDLADTVDYGSLVDRVKAAIESDPVDLIERLAQRIADLCLADGRVALAQVTVHKPEAPIAATFSDVALTITRSRP